MKVNVTIPQLGESVVEGTILEWAKKEGDFVKKDEVLLVISTEKVNAEVPAPATGRIHQILVGEGETVPVGTTVATLETEVGEAEAPEAEIPEAREARRREEAVAQEQEEPRISPLEPAKVEAERPKAPEVERREETETQKPEEAPRAAVSPPPRISPLARTIAEKEGVPLEDLEQLPGSGPGGRVMKQDILSDLEARRKIQERKPEPLPPPPQQVERPAEAPSREVQRPKAAEQREDRRVAAAPTRRIAQLPGVPHAVALIEVDMTNLIQYLERIKETFERQEGIPLTYLPFILLAAVKALKQFPTLNASREAEEVALKESTHLGFTVPLEGGSVTPVIKDADSLNLLGMARIVRDLTQRAKAKKLEPEELQGGTFTVSDTGAFGAVVDAPIIHPSQVAILGIGAIKKRPVVVEDMIGIRPVMYASLSYDYRFIDGITAVQFLQTFAQTLEAVDFKL